eukprot:2009954-Pleurochrysis_carterae.AAC.1
MRAGRPRPRRAGHAARLCREEHGHESVSSFRPGRRRRRGPPCLRCAPHAAHERVPVGRRRPHRGLR